MMDRLIVQYENELVHGKGQLRCTEDSNKILLENEVFLSKLPDFSKDFVLFVFLCISSQCTIAIRTYIME